MSIRHHQAMARTDSASRLIKAQRDRVYAAVVAVP
jgi:hypothetical protein